MKILRIVGMVSATLLFVILAIPAVLPNHVHVERSIEIQATSAKTFAYLSDFNNFAKWNPFSEMEPQAHIEVQGTGVGSTYYWKGKETGEGRMTLTRLEKDALVQIKMNFIQPMPAEADVQWKVESNPNGSKMIWSMDEDFSYFHRFFGMMMEKMIGPSFDKGLQNLKKHLET